jgi:hypothetical protein
MDTVWPGCVAKLLGAVMKKVVEVSFDMFVMKVTLTMSSWFASTNAELAISPARTWYGRLRGPALPIPGGVLSKNIRLLDVVEAGGLEKYVAELVRKTLRLPQASRTRKPAELAETT